jgi:hypothetical protein
MITRTTTNFWNSNTWKQQAAIYSPDNGGEGKACLVWFGGRGEAASIDKLVNTYVFGNITNGWKPDFNVLTFTGNSSGVYVPLSSQTMADYFGRVLDYVKDVIKADPTRIYLAGLSGGGCAIFDWLTASQELCDSVAAILPASPMQGGWEGLVFGIDWSKTKSIGTAGLSSGTNGDLAFYNRLFYVSNLISSSGGKSEVRPVINGGHTASTWNPFYAPTSDVWQWLVQQKTGQVIEPVKEIARYEVSFLSDGSNKATKVSGVDLTFEIVK